MQYGNPNIFRFFAKKIQNEDNQIFDHSTFGCKYDSFGISYDICRKR